MELNAFDFSFFEGMEIGIEIEQVPVELVAHAFSFLKPQELVNTSLVCKSWNIISKDITVWKHHAKRFGREEASPLDGKKFVQVLQEIKSAYPEVVKAALGGAAVIANLPIIELDSFIADLTAQDITSKIMRGKVLDNHFLLFSYKLTVAERTQFAACILIVSKAEDIGLVDIFNRACEPLYICDRFYEGLRSYSDCERRILELLKKGKLKLTGDDLSPQIQKVWEKGKKIKMDLELCDPPELTILDRRIVSKPSYIWELITNKLKFWDKEPPISQLFW